MIKLADGEHIVAVAAEVARGPGWRHEPLWVFIYSPCGGWRQACLHLAEQTQAMRALFPVCAKAHEEMLKAVIGLCNRRGA